MSEYIITKEQIEELNRAYGGMKIVTSWLSCYAIWDTSNTYPVMKSEHVAVDLPEIVRCRDCDLSHEDELGNLRCHGPLTDPWDYYNDEPSDGVEVEPSGFCAWGERRERESAEVWNQWSADDVTCSEES